MRILSLDIETTPAIVYVWSLRPDYIPPSHVIKPSQMLCWAAKWLGEPEVEFRGLKPDGQKRMVKRLWRLLDEADSVLHYNGKRFDVPHVQREFLQAGLLPPSPFKQIDLLVTCRRQFKFDANKLERVSEQLGIGRKEEHEGFKLWTRCMAGEQSAWERMRRYNEKDCRLNETLYMKKLRPWILSHPSHGAQEGRDICSKCGSDKLEARGFASLRTGRYRRFHCTSCGSWMRSTERHDKTTITEVA